MLIESWFLPLPAGSRRGARSSRVGRRGFRAVTSSRRRAARAEPDNAGARHGGVIGRLPVGRIREQYEYCGHLRSAHARWRTATRRWRIRLCAKQHERRMSC